jgi:hypothetical protein
LPPRRFVALLSDDLSYMHAPLFMLLSSYPSTIFSLALIPISNHLLMSLLHASFNHTLVKRNDGKIKGKGLALYIESLFNLAYFMPADDL